MAEGDCCLTPNLKEQCLASELSIFFLFFQKEMFGIDLIIFCVSLEIDPGVLDEQQ